jgi:hypothetical protein
VIAYLVATSDKTGLNADEGRFTLNTQMIQCGSQAVDNAFDFQTPCSKPALAKAEGGHDAVSFWGHFNLIGNCTNTSPTER